MTKLLQKIYGSRFNPLYQSGVLAVFFILLAVISGLILIIFYRVSAPYESVVAMQANPILAVIRGVHRYSSDAAVLAVVVHALKMFVGKCAFGPRARAWASGVFLTALMIVIGLSGLMLVWDVQAQRLALAGVRIVEMLPIFSEPPRRIFADQSNVGSAFFFILVFFHMAMPLGLAFLLWMHTSRLARAVYLPEKAICALWTGAIVVIALLIPAPMDPAADLTRLPGGARLDLWYTFWLPLEEKLGGPATALLMVGVMGLVAAYPWLGRPAEPPPPSVVDEKFCDGCTQCYQDCPYDAISMVARTFYNDGRHSELVARVDPDLCVSCGICAASCKPMGVGPPERTGRDQMKTLESTLKATPLKGDELVVLACATGCGMSSEFRNREGIRLIPTPCSGSLHTSVMELALRRGALGVMVISCPSRDCTNREGPKWLEQRVYHDREAELMARVDRRRVRLEQASRADSKEAVTSAVTFLEELRALAAPEPLEEMESICVPPSDI